MLKGNVFITGGAGFLGRGIMRRALAESWPCQFTIYSRDEQKQYEARRRYPDARYVLGDITQPERMSLVMAGHDTVIHTAALKYIPEGEMNPWETIRVNIDGSRMVMDAARDVGVRTCVMISTDKAPQPVNTYGMTKALVERLVHAEFESHDRTKFVACRYGNVIGSTGSIWPVWRSRIANDQSLLLTDADMTRYFMTINEAVDVIDYAVNHGVRGTVIIPAPRAQRIGNLIKYVADHFNVLVEDIGARPGEKMHEQMISANEALRLFDLGTYFMLLPPGHHVDGVPPRSELLYSSLAPAAWISDEEFFDAGNESEEV